MRRSASIASTIGMAAAVTFFPASAATAADKPCIAQLGSSAPGIMEHVADDWRDDFLGFGWTPGQYAVGIAKIRTGCP